MIKIETITKHFGKFKALDEVSVNFGKGECIALIGPNGCGKTTLIKSILGMVVPEKGAIYFKGKSIGSDWKYRSEIGYMPQIGRYPDNMSIGQVIEMMKDLRKSNNNGIDEELLNEFEITGLYNKRMATLSGGTRQKVSAVLAFMFNPEVLILDEPTAGLDPLSSEILKEKIIREKNKGKLILITSHILSELDELISHVVFMQEGKLKFHKSIDELKAGTGEQRLSKAIARVMSREGVSNE